MFGLVSKRKADEMAVGWMRLQKSICQRDFDKAVAELGEAIAAKKKELEDRAMAAEARCKALERRLDGWVPADQASSMRWRIAELEAHVVEIRTVASALRQERDTMRAQLAVIAAEDDAGAVAAFAPGQPVVFSRSADRDTVTA